MHIRNLNGIFTGEGFANRDGRQVRAQDCGFVRGPIDIAIDNGVIRTVGTSLDPAGESIDGSGMIATPGFIDPHTHAIFAGERSDEYFMRWAGKTYLEITESGGGIHSTVRATSLASDDSLRLRLRERLREMLACGATTVEVKSGYASSAEGELRLLRVIRSVADDRDLPEVRPSFLALHALPKGRTEREYVDQMIDVLSVVASEKLAAQVDSFPEKGFFTRDEAVRLSQAAGKLGLPCKVHADELSDLGTTAAFAKSGALSVDHLQCISDHAVDLLSASPTVATMLPATSFFVGLPYANARRLLDAGARVALATDFNPGTAPAMDLQLTHMLAASQMKMSSAEILCASTFNAAAALGLEKSHGVVAPGRIGDVLLFESDLARSDDGTNVLRELILSRARPAQVIHRGRAIPPTQT
jgi:imidazolonepropionase